MLFFFQAEDGIRDTSVTGVQTCALPIWRFRPCVLRPVHDGGLGMDTSSDRRGGRGEEGFPHSIFGLSFQKRRHTTFGSRRSEERRVGKECRYGGGADHWKREL